jgi:hypothetical protein
MQKIVNEHQDWLDMQNGIGNWNTCLYSCVCLPRIKFHQPFPSINFKRVTEKEIYGINKSLKWKNSCGYDEVPSRIVKLSSSDI